MRPLSLESIVPQVRREVIFQRPDCLFVLTRKPGRARLVAFGRGGYASGVSRPLPPVFPMGRQCPPGYALPDI